MALSRGFYSFVPSIDESWKWPNFRPEEFACTCEHCGDSYFHDPDFLDSMQSVRNVCGPLIINSGFRCALHNEDVGGAERSQHLVIAADVSLHNHPDRWKLETEFKANGFAGIGRGANFIHVDKRSHPAQWYYGSESIQAWMRASGRDS